MAVKMKSGALNTQGSDRWYVTDGANAVGPVKLELLTRGIEGGRVPLDSFVRHEAWKVWRPLSDFAVTTDDSQLAAPATPRSPDAPLPQFPLSDRGVVITPRKPPSLADFATAEGVPSRASTSSVPPPPSSAHAAPSLAEGEPTWTQDDDLASNPSGDCGDTPYPGDAYVGDPLDLRPARSTDDIPESAGGKRGWGNARPADSTDSLPDDDLRGASDLADALLLLLGGAVKRTRADVALLHRVDDRGAVVACAHGWLGGAAGELSPLGSHTSSDDPIVAAALAGSVVLAEPSPGTAGSAMLRRLAPNGLQEALELTGPHLLLPGEPAVACRPVLAALMLPIMVGGRCYAFLELGKGAPFTGREIAKADDLVRAFTRLVVDGGLA